MQMRKGLVLVIVLGIMLVLLALAFGALYLMTQQARVAEHKIRRLRAFFAAQAGTIHTHELLRKGYPAEATHQVGAGIGQGYPLGGLTANISVTPVPPGTTGTVIDGTNRVDVTVNY